jgi:NAD(P)-dependent dehydrogenase (short-subunit alcohol dehydrogenase family)
MPTTLITGASRGIGLELTRQYAALGWTVLATCRDPGAAADLRAVAGDVSLHPLDVVDHAQVDALAAKLNGAPIDVLINNAGIGGRGAALGGLDYALWREVMEVDMVGPVKVSETFLPNVLAGGRKKIVAVSSSLGSISETKGGNYFYRTAKAALNMAMRTMAMDLAPQGVVVALLSPGIVDTDFTAGARMPKIPVQDSAAGLIRQIEALTPDKAGQFIRYNGDTVAW